MDAFGLLANAIPSLTTRLGTAPSRLLGKVRGLINCHALLSAEPSSISCKTGRMASAI
jgi:hypothetical protein